MSFNNNTSDLYCMDGSEPDQNIPVDYESSGTTVFAPESSSTKREAQAKRDLVKVKGELQVSQVSNYTFKSLPALASLVACLIRLGYAHEKEQSSKIKNKIKN